MLKPILFNTDMVRAILDGRKTATRRIVKAPVLYSGTEPPSRIFWDGDLFQFKWNTGKTVGEFSIKPPYLPGDVLYVRETWSTRPSNECYAQPCHGGVCPYESCESADGPCFPEEYIYKASHSLPSSGGKWHPSIHMPKEAARIFLRVPDVRVERLKEIGNCVKEGIPPGTHATAHMNEIDERAAFACLWNSTLKPENLSTYGWDANPYVWVIEFERCEKPEA